MIPLLKNSHLKILAVLSAITLWFFVVGIENIAYRFPEDLDIHVIGTPENLSLTNDIGKAKILIRANQGLIKTLTKSDFDVYIDLSNRSEGAYDVKLQATAKNNQVSILKIIPSTVHVVIEPIAEKEIKIKSTVSGNPQKGYAVKDVQLDRSTATVKGAKSVLAKITSLKAVVTLDGSESTTFKKQVELIGLENDPAAKNLVIDPPEVGVEVTVFQELQQKSVIVKPVLKGTIDPTTAPKQLEIIPTVVTIQGKEDVLNNILTIETEPIDIETLKSATRPVSVRLIIPKGVTLLDPAQPNVLVGLKSAPVPAPAPVTP